MLYLQRNESHILPAELGVTQTVPGSESWGHVPKGHPISSPGSCCFHFGFIFSLKSIFFSCHYGSVISGQLSLVSLVLLRLCFQFLLEKKVFSSQTSENSLMPCEQQFAGALCQHLSIRSQRCCLSKGLLKARHELSELSSTRWTGDETSQTLKPNPRKQCKQLKTFPWLFAHVPFY